MPVSSVPPEKLTVFPLAFPEEEPLVITYPPMTSFLISPPEIVTVLEMASVPSIVTPPATPKYVLPVVPPEMTTLFPEALPLAMAPITIPASPPVTVTVLPVAATPETPPIVIVTVPPLTSTVLFTAPCLPSVWPTTFPPYSVPAVPPLKMTLLSCAVVLPLPPSTSDSVPVPVASMVTVLPEAEPISESPPNTLPAVFPDSMVTVLLSALPSLFVSSPAWPP